MGKNSSLRVQYSLVLLKSIQEGFFYCTAYSCSAPKASVRRKTVTLKNGCLYYWFPENSCLFPHHVLVIDELCNLISSILLLSANGKIHKNIHAGTVFLLV